MGTHHDCSEALLSLAFVTWNFVFRAEARRSRYSQDKLQPHWEVERKQLF